MKDFMKNFIDKLLQAISVMLAVFILLTIKNLSLRVDGAIKESFFMTILFTLFMIVLGIIRFVFWKIDKFVSCGNENSK